MLNSMRNAADSFAVKALFMVLLASFALWGIGDVFRGGGVTSVAKVGDHKISRYDFEQMVQEESNRFKQLFSANDVPASVKSAIEGNVLNRFIDQSLLEEEVRSRGIRVSEAQVMQHIQSEPAFQENGTFNKDRFRHLLKQNGITEKRYVSLLRQGLSRDTYIESLTGAAIPLSTQADLLFRFEKEKREVAVLRIPQSLAGTLPTPDDAALQAYYDAHKDMFMTPAYRSFSYLTLTAADVKEDIQLTDEAISDYYTANQDMYLDTTGKAKPLDAVKEDIRKELTLQKQEALLYDTVTRLEDLLAGGAGLEEAAAQAGLKTQKTGPISRDGVTDTGGKATNLPANPAIMNIAFAQAEDASPTLQALPDHSYVAIQIDAIQAPAPRPLEEVKPHVLSAWKDEERKSRIAAIGTEVRKALEEGATPLAVAQKFSLPSPQTVAITRNPESAPTNIPGNLLDSAFNTAIGKPTNLAGTENGDLAVAVVTRVFTADAPSDMERFPLVMPMEEEFYQDVMTYYGRYLRTRHPVEVYIKIAPEPQAAE